MKFLTTLLNRLRNKFPSEAIEVPAYQINRHLVVIIPQEPFAKWAAKTIDSESEYVLLVLRTSEQVSFLLPQANIPRHRYEDVIKKHYTSIFDYMLLEWEPDTQKWPQDRSYKKFTEWFDAIYSDQVFDMCDEPLKHNT